MCGRYRLTRADRLAETFEAVCCADEDLKPRYNIAPTQLVPVVRMNGTARAVASIRWGLIPFWAKDALSSHINAKSETLLEKPAFKESFHRRRCLIPSDGFYEWKWSLTSKQPFHFGMKDESLFAFAGIWDRWRPKQGPFIESCAILTTAPNELLRDVHDRMPVIIRAEHYDVWLNAPASEVLRHSELLQPFQSELMKRFLVGSFVNDPLNDSPECAIESLEIVPAQAELFRSFEN